MGIRFWFSFIGTAIASFSHGQTAEQHFATGCGMGSARDFHGALSEYNKAIAINPDYTEAYFNRGGIKFNMKDFRGASDDYTKVIQV
jgi:tetratricopeptide (TPR) repeat protein